MGTKARGVKEVLGRLQDVSELLLTVQKELTSIKQMVRNGPDFVVYSREAKRIAKEAAEDERARLAVVLEQEGMSRKEVAGLLNLSTSRMSRLLDNMYHRGMVQRMKEDPDYEKVREEVEEKYRKKTLRSLAANGWDSSDLFIPFACSAHKQTVRELVMSTPEDLLRLYSVGQKSLGVVERELDALGLHLGMTSEEFDEFKRSVEEME